MLSTSLKIKSTPELERDQGCCVSSHGHPFDHQKGATFLFFHVLVLLYLPWRVKRVLVLPHTMTMALEQSLSGNLFAGRMFYQESLGNFLGLLCILAEPES